MKAYSYFYQPLLGCHDTMSIPCAQVKRLHKLNNPDTPLPMSGNELADVIKNAATGALEVLQQSYSMPNFCELPPLPPTSWIFLSCVLSSCYRCGKQPDLSQPGSRPC